ncbi:hypothetical protein F5Y12DRAFT_214430 [Xylaria sp. FL1777]|nr:hypothetical protein F5Y12DRAFT_214430 [Xylaria sp. FL1777]
MSVLISAVMLLCFLSIASTQYHKVSVFMSQYIIDRYREKGQIAECVEHRDYYFLVLRVWLCPSLFRTIVVMES